MTTSYDTEQAHPQLGDWVRDQYGRIGQVYTIHSRCPESDSWLNRQERPVTTAQINSPWVSILVDGGGSCVQPVSTVEVIEPLDRPLANSWAEHYGLLKPAPAPAPAVATITCEACGPGGMLYNQDGAAWPCPHVFPDILIAAEVGAMIG